MLLAARHSLRRWGALLQVRLALIGVFAMVLAVGLSEWLLLRSAEQATVQQHEERERTEARRIAAFLDRSLTAQGEALALVGVDIGAQQGVDPSRLRDLLRARPLLRAQFKRLLVVSSDGRPLVQLDRQGRETIETLAPDIANMLKPARAGQRALLSGLLRDHDGDPEVLLAQPLFDGPVVTGLLVGVVSLRDPPLLERLGEGKARSAELLLTDAQGQVMAASDPRRIGSGASDWPLLADALQAWQEAGSPRLSDGASLGHGGRLTTVAVLPASGWLLWRLQSREQVLAPLTAARQRALAAGTAAALLVGLAMLALIWRSLRPLNALRDRAEHLFDPAIDPAQGWPQTQDEIGELAVVLRRVGLERREHEQRSSHLLRQLQTVLGAAPLGIMVTRERRFELLSPEALRLLGRTESELLGQPAELIYADAARYRELGPLVAKAFAERKVFSADLHFRRGDDGVFWGRLSGHPVDWGDAWAGTVWTLADVSEEVAENAALAWRASHDPLTGLSNRAGLRVQLERLVAAGAAARPACLLLMDLDRFKPINDLHGHAAGDAMLRAVARVLLACVRHGDLAARQGGDEFAVLLERCDRSAGRRVAQQILDSVRALRVEWEGQSLQVGVSIGLAPLEQDDLEAWIAAADAAAYAAKAAGRDQVQEAPS